MLNWLTLSYEGNQLVKVTDDGYTPIDYTTKRYQDGENAQKEMFYDKNGALTADFDRKICTIRNNLLTLPDTIQFSNGNQIVHIYDAMGNRLRTTYYTRKVALVNPVCTTIPGTDNLQEYNIVSYAMLGNKRYVRYNHGSWALEHVYNPEGYIRYYGPEEHYSFYYIKDHLGNVCAVWSAETNSFVQKTFYYPSGVPINISTNQSTQPYKYNGKPYEEMHGFDIYEYEARGYYAAIMRFTAMDPLCEQTPWQSPYAYAANNPVCNVDWMGLGAWGFGSAYGGYQMTVVDNYGKVIYHIDNGNPLVFLFEGDNFDEENISNNNLLVIGFEDPNVCYTVGGYHSFWLLNGSYYSGEFRSVMAVEGYRNTWLWGMNDGSSLHDANLGDKTDVNLFVFLGNAFSSGVGIYSGIFCNEFFWQGKNGNWYRHSQIHTQGGYAYSYNLAKNAPIRIAGKVLTSVVLITNVASVAINREIKPSDGINIAMGAISYSGVGAIVSGAYFVIDAFVLFGTGSSIGQKLDNKYGSLTF